ncbi:MAG TPA: bifunctional hydroxymethylpyrimidine kinase/phosphomethylpyrimidine kinase [Methylomirabilota bacterium]|nr:bifunctional hydroxymethylpyrimidine kinase/phosphomethylpyrimidine kinase [Methylomirabilota bacterium]
MRESWPVALTIAGSDSGGGAGIQADLKTFAALKVHGASAITCITAQNPAEVTGVHAIPPEMVRAQIEAGTAELPPAAIKTGMLYSVEIIQAVAETLAQRASRVPLVVDPVLVATSGARLLKSDAEAALQQLLLPRATLITPNIPEAEALCGSTMRSKSELQAAAKTLADRFQTAILLKGGHSPDDGFVVDLLCHENQITELRAPFVAGIKTHGTGCTFSAAITAELARGTPLMDAVRSGKLFIESVIKNGYWAGEHFTLNPRPRM